MSRRRRQSLSQPGMSQDPGKDLFAYLFLLVMVFAFMLLMTLQDVRGEIAAQQAPQQPPAAARASLVSIAPDQLGRLVRAENGLVLEFADQRYDPVGDLDRLRQDGRLIESAGTSTLYLEEQARSKVLLAEYLEAFINLSHAGINVAFAEAVR